MRTAITNVAFAVSALLAGAAPLLYADWTSGDAASRLNLHLVVLVAVGIMLGMARPPIEHSARMLARWMRGL